MVIDPNELSPDGSISLAQAVPSPDGKSLAYALSEGGADWQTVHVRDLATGKDVAGTASGGFGFPGSPGPMTAKGFSTAVSRTARRAEARSRARNSFALLPCGRHADNRLTG